MTEGPLSGLRIVVTRAAAQAGATTCALEAAGARVALLPLLEVVPADDRRPLERATHGLVSYDWVVFTSANGVDAVFDAPGIQIPAELRTAAVGPATAAALRRRGNRPRIALEAGPVNARELLAALEAQLEPGARILLPQAADARSDLASGLAAAGFRTDRVTAYSKRVPQSTPERARQLFDTVPIGWVTFASGRAARHFAELFGDAWAARKGELRAASIGPVTSAELRAVGVEPSAEAARPADSDLVAAISAAFAGTRR